MINSFILLCRTSIFHSRQNTLLYTDLNVRRRPDKYSLIGLKLSQFNPSMLESVLLSSNLAFDFHLRPRVSSNILDIIYIYIYIFKFCNQHFVVINNKCHVFNHVKNMRQRVEMSTSGYYTYECNVQK